jgi:hypothetical protein
MNPISLKTIYILFIEGVLLALAITLLVYFFYIKPNDTKEK